jgi:GMP synthase (glutamine-hydrolysing)
MIPRRALIFQHTPTEGPERAGALCAERGLDLDVRQLHRGDAIPSALGADQILIVMGGPMGVNDAGDARYPFLAGELAFLKSLVARDAPVLGICLGAQLLAAAAGARVYPAARREVGWAPVDFIGVEREPALAGIGAREMMLHWHGDTFDLPPGAVHLASTEIAPHQAFRLGTRQLGLQFHCELGAETIATWVREDAEFVALANGPGGGERILADTARHLPAAAAVGDRLLRNVIGILLGG